MPPKVMDSGWRRYRQVLISGILLGIMTVLTSVVYFGYVNSNSIGTSKFFVLHVAMVFQAASGIVFLLSLKDTLMKNRRQALGAETDNFNSSKLLKPVDVIKTALGNIDSTEADDDGHASPEEYRDALLNPWPGHTPDETVRRNRDLPSL